MKKLEKRLFTLLILLTFSFIVMADVRSTGSDMNFDVNADGTREMVLNSTGLGIGAVPGANLHVGGNVVITQSLSIGGSSSSTSNLHLEGTMGSSLGMVSGNAFIGDDSVVLANSSLGDIILELPSSSSKQGVIVTVKKTSISNRVMIHSNDPIDGSHSVILSSGNLASISLFSSGEGWFVLYKRDLSEPHLSISEDFESGTLGTGMTVVDGALNQVQDGKGLGGSKGWGTTTGSLTSAAIAVGSDNIVIPTLSSFSFKSRYEGGSSGSTAAYLAGGWLTYSGNFNSWLSEYKDANNNNVGSRGQYHSLVGLYEQSNNVWAFAVGDRLSAMTSSNGHTIGSGNATLIPGNYYEIQGTVGFDGVNKFNYNVSLNEYNTAGNLLRDNILEATGTHQNTIGLEGRFVFESYGKSGFGFRHMDELYFSTF